MQTLHKNVKIVMIYLDFWDDEGTLKWGLYLNTQYQSTIPHFRRTATNVKVSINRRHSDILIVYFNYTIAVLILDSNAERRWKLEKKAKH